MSSSDFDRLNQDLDFCGLAINLAEIKINFSKELAAFQEKAVEMIEKTDNEEMKEKLRQLHSLARGYSKKNLEEYRSFVGSDNRPLLIRVK